MEPPIQNIENIDIVGRRKDGGVDLGIVVSSRLDATPEHKRMLLHKFASYLAQLNTPQFRAEFGDPPDDRVRIVLFFSTPPDPAILELVEQIKPWVEEHHARLSVQASEVG